MTQKIFIGSDHAGFELKEHLVNYLDGLEDCNVEDLGTYSDERCDYPGYAKEVAKKVLDNKDSVGILVCGTGIGMSMTANKFAGIRAALCRDENDAKLSREHNNANVLCLGGRITKKEAAEKITKAWLTTDFSDEGRHKQRVEKIDVS